jgi:isopenicillin N synthase-like dioxygenase
MRKQAGHDLVEAMEKTGIIYIANHGIDKGLTKDVYN